MQLKRLADKGLDRHDLHPLGRVLEADAQEDQARDGQVRRRDVERDGPEFRLVVAHVDLEARGEVAWRGGVGDEVDGAGYRGEVLEGADANKDGADCAVDDERTSEGQRRGGKRLPASKAARTLMPDSAKVGTLADGCRARNDKAEVVAAGREGSSRVSPGRKR